jgi:hypothetical protein
MMAVAAFWISQQRDKYGYEYISPLINVQTYNRTWVLSKTFRRETKRNGHRKQTFMEETMPPIGISTPNVVFHAKMSSIFLVFGFSLC